MARAKGSQHPMHVDYDKAVFLAGGEDALLEGVSASQKTLWRRPASYRAANGQRGGVPPGALLPKLLKRLESGDLRPDAEQVRLATAFQAVANIVLLTLGEATGRAAQKRH